MAEHRAWQTAAEHAFIESFNGRLRDELLNETHSAHSPMPGWPLAEWRLDYNTIRPHSSLGNLPPAPLRHAQRSGVATGPDAARNRGLCAPPRCRTEPRGHNHS